jgi:nucleoid-associated protein YgaU
MRYLIGALMVAAVAFMGCEKKAEVKATHTASPDSSKIDTLEGAPPPKDSVIRPLPPVDVKPLPPVDVKPLPPVDAGPGVYTVQQGDKGLMDIARRELGNASRWREIEALNPGVDTRKLKVGVQLKMPAK